MPQELRHPLANLKMSRLPSAAQLSLLPHVLTARQKRALLLGIVMLLISASALFWRLTSPLRITVPKVGGTITEAVVGAPRSLNPLFATLSAADLDVTKLLYPGLAAADFRDPRIFIPVLAEQLTINPDGKTYTVKLKKDLRWHDGTPLTSDDVLFTVERIQDPKVQSPLAPSLARVVSRKLDERTVEFVLPTPLSPFPASLTFGVLPRHRWQGRTNWLERDEQLIGSGPFRFKTLQRGTEGGISSIILVRNSAWPSPPWIETLQFRFFPTAEQAQQAFENGRADLMLTSANERSASLLEQRLKTHRAITLSIPEYTALFFNPREQPLFTDPLVRKALALALEKGSLIRDAFGSEAEEAHGPFPQSIFSIPATPARLPDARQAARLFEQAGWRLVNGVRLNSQKKVLRFTITTSDAPSFIRLAQGIAEQWKALGVQVDVRTVEASRFFSDVLRVRSYDALVYGQNLGADPDPFAFWHSSQEDDPGYNLALWRNARADELIEQARTRSDMKGRRALYGELSKLLGDQAPAIFFTHPRLTYLLPKKLSLPELSSIAIPADRYVFISDWYIKTRSQWALRRKK